MKKTAKDLAMMCAGTALVAVGDYFFKFPNHFSTGGVAGIGVLLTRAFPGLSASTLVTALNLLFLVLGFVVLNRGFGVRTVICTLLFSGMLEGLAWLCPLAGPLTDQKLLELLFAVILPALGSALLFRIEASTGGMDIAAMILRKFTHLNIGKALLACDLLIAASAFFVFGVETGLFSVLGLVIQSLLVDSVMDSLDRRKSFLVITADPEPVCEYILKSLHRSATVWEGKGAYTGDRAYLVLAALTPHQAFLLRRYVRGRDPHAFILITSTSEVYGKGFFQG